MNAFRSILLAAIAMLCAHAHAASLLSPDRHIGVDVSVAANGSLNYSFAHVQLDLFFLGERGGMFVTDGEGERHFTLAPIRAGKTKISIKPHGGFVAAFK